MTPTAKILLVDDEPAVRLTLVNILTREGHQVVAVESGQAALVLIAGQIFDLALLDLNLGDINGIEVLAALKQQSPDTVAIMLTAQASLETAIEALRQGAHDYLFKPCQIIELRQSIHQGLLKRRQAIRQRKLLHQLGAYFANNLEDIQAVVAEQPELPTSVPTGRPMAESLLPVMEEEVEAQPGRFQGHGSLIVDFLRHVIILDGRLLELSPTEFSLLAYLVSEAPRLIPPPELLQAIQGYESPPWEASETIRVHIYHIRQKIKKIAGRSNVIRNIRGVGYTIEA